MTALEQQQTEFAVRVRPKVSLLGNAFASIVLGTAPVFGVLYWFASTHGGIEYVVAANVVVLAVGLLLLWRQLSVYCAVTETEVIGNGIFSPLIRVPLRDVREVLLVPTFVGAAPDPVLQLLVRDAAGRCVFRMRGTYWHDADLLALGAALPAPVERVAEPMSMKDFFRVYPTAAYWFENRPVLLVTLIVLAILAALSLAIGVMLALGMPVRFLP